MKLYNSFSQTKEDFSPANDQPIKLYVCGVTPYDTTHLGHAFTYIFFDALVRWLQFKKYNVQYLQNVTDIDDDILRKAKEQNTDWKSLGDFWTNKYRTDMKNLHALEPTYYVKATDSIETIVKMVKGLMEKGYAYEVDGNVYFDVKKFPEYGQLSHYSEAQMTLLSKERGADPYDKNKHNPLDFILWQKAKPGEPSWDSPWTPIPSGSSVSSGASSGGRPGWHIECSAMNYQYLGEQIDLHGGGRDLIYPHHESEIAQTESYTSKKPFSKFWLHTAMVMYQGEKMSKSLGNLVLVSDLLKTYDADTIRYVLLSHHYRTPWEFDESELENAKNNLKDIRDVILHPLRPSEARGEAGSRLDKTSLEQEILQQFADAMDDDMQTHKALEIMQRTKDKNTVRQMATMLGFTL